MTNIIEYAQSTAQPRVLSYIRFSSAKQGKGTSVERQQEMAREWCDKKGWKLDEFSKFRDDGVSAFSGANAHTGDLAKLQHMLATGEIAPGTHLIVEAFDRITRQGLQPAIALTMSLINSGLVIVTLNDGKVWDKNAMSDLSSFMMSVITLYRGHDESNQKSRRLRKTFKIHRENGSKQAFGTAPGWLSRDSKFSPWVVDKEKAESVRRVFELAAGGLGQKAIAKIANDEQWLVPTRLGLTGKRWHAQMAGQLLRNRAVVGEHQHRITTYEAREQHWRGLAVGEPIKGYYDPIVSEELWRAARASINGRTVAKRRDVHYYNIFSGLMYCGWCGAPIQRKNGTKGYSRAQLNCADRIAGLTKCATMSAKNADGPLLEALYEHSHESLRDEGAHQKSEEIAALEHAIKEIREQTEHISDAIAASGGRITAFVNKSIRLQDEFEVLSIRLETLQGEEAAKGDGVFDQSFVEDALSYLYLSDDHHAKEKRAGLNVRLARLVETIWIFAYDCAFIKYKNDKLIHAVPLPGKRLPSRVNPDAKYHVKPKDWEEPFKPIWNKHFTVGVALPEPRRPKPLKWRASGLVAPIYDNEDEHEGDTLSSGIPVA